MAAGGRQDASFLEAAAVSLKEGFFLDRIGAGASRPVDGKHLVTASRTTPARQHSETGIHDVLEEQRIELAQSAGSVSRFGQHGIAIQRGQRIARSYALAERDAQ